MAQGKVAAAAVVAALCVFLQLCDAAVELPCTVTQDGRLPKYNILHDFADFPSDPSSFDYSWSNGSDIVLAKQEGSTDPVKNHSINTLVSLRCIDNVRFTATSFSKGKVEKEYNATCSIKCEFSHIHCSNENNCSFSTASPVTDTSTKIALGVLIPILILILVLAGLYFLWYKCRDRIHRMRCDSRGRVFYTGVNMTNTGAPVVQV
ncbi:uncharacterized protein LOC111574661 [Amphiprion ocellaris]|uniref:uncharacterized protein LOC111574661 n=1 Tax=Amphiprion ocellaris TaxID=80972 RepID=UPI000C2FFF4F|nr:uncharacterized protein LOC111574661 [Amphiprion ocellaris]